MKVSDKIITRLPGWKEVKLLKIWKKEDTPVVFCHVEGAEKSEAVSTAEGSEQSKSNDAERDHVVCIITPVCYIIYMGVISFFLTGIIFDSESIFF